MVHRVAGAAEGQFGPVLFERLLFVAVDAAAVHGLFVRACDHREGGLSIYRCIIFVALLTNFHRPFEVFFLGVAFLAAFVAAQGVLMGCMIKDRSRLVVIGVALPAGGGFIIGFFEMVANPAIALTTVLIRQPELVIEMGEIDKIARPVSIDAERFPAGCGTHRNGRCNAPQG